MEEVEVYLASLFSWSPYFALIILVQSWLPVKLKGSLAPICPNIKLKVVYSWSRTYSQPWDQKTHILPPSFQQSLKIEKKKEVRGEGLSKKTLFQYLAPGKWATAGEY